MNISRNLCTLYANPPIYLQCSFDLLQILIINKLILYTMKKTTPTNRQTANNNWKDANFSLFGLINYCVKNYKSDAALRNELKPFCDLAPGTSHKELKEVFTIDAVKAAIGDYNYKFKRVEIEPNKFKMQVTDQTRERFSLYTFLTYINKK